MTSSAVPATGRDHTAPSTSGGGDRGRFLWPLAVCLATLAFTMIPLVTRSSFYLRGDSATQFAPTWVHLGDLLRGGSWPIWLDPHVWAGGNYAAEALHGIYNPLNALIWLVASGIPNLLVSTLLVKAAFMAMLALGGYLLIREYGAERWAAAAIAVVIPFTGFLLYWDASSWADELIAFAYLPWVWWSFRRTLRGTLNPWWAFVIGVLAVTQGDPYGALGVVVVGVAVLIEGLVAGERRAAGTLAWVGVCVAAFLPLVYLPLLHTAGVAARSGGPAIANRGTLRPDAADLLGLSSPTWLPAAKGFGGVPQVPSAYFCWFLVPLLPWLRYDVLRTRARELSGIAVFALIYLLLCLGPEKLWLFRWPFRLVDCLYLAVAVAFALVLSQGLRRDRWRHRVLGTVALVAITAYLTWAQRPDLHGAALGGTAMVVVATAALLCWHRWAPAVPAVLAALLIASTGTVLLGQTYVFRNSNNVRDLHLPTDLAAVRAQFADRAGLRVAQFANFGGLSQRRPQAIARIWRHYLIGSMYQAANVDAVNSYSGIGYKQFSEQLCERFDGLTRPCGYRHFFKPSVVGQPSMADLLKVQLVVVQPRLARGVTAPAGWHTTRQHRVILVRRTTPVPWPGSDLSEVSPGVQVTSARTVSATQEQVQIASTGASGPARLTFARLAWPGYSASFDHRRIPVHSDDAGLLWVSVPHDRSGSLSVTFRPPGLDVGVGAAALGLLAAALQAGWVLRERRRRR